MLRSRFDFRFTDTCASLDDIVIFTPLSKKNLRDIVRIQMANVGKRLEELDIDVVVRDEAADTIVTQSYDVTMGVTRLDSCMCCSVSSLMFYIDRRVRCGAGSKSIW